MGTTPDDPRHTALWYPGPPGDPHGTSADPSLLRIGADEVLAAALAHAGHRSTAGRAPRRRASGRWRHRDVRDTRGRDGARAADDRTTVAMITKDRPASALRTLDRLAALPERPLSSWSTTDSIRP